MARILSTQGYLMLMLLLYITTIYCDLHVNNTVEIFSGVILGAKKFFNVECVYFLESNGIHTKSQTVELWKMLSCKLFSSGVQTLSMDNLPSCIRSCNSRIFPIINDVNTRSHLEMLSKANQLRGSVWIIYLNESIKLDEYFMKMNIPFDCELLVAQRESSTGIVRLIEVHRVVDQGPLQKIYFGFWNWKRGFVGPKTSFYDRRHDLQGLTFLTTNNEEDAPISYLYKDGGDNRTKLGGFSGNLWKIFEKRLRFQSDHRVPDDGMWGSRDENGTWDGMIGDITSGNANMTAIGITVTSERAEYVRFSSPLFVSFVRIYIRKPSQEVSIWGLVTPFRPELWAALLLSVIIPSLIHSLICNIEGNKDDVEGHSLKDILFQFFGAMFCQQALISNPQAFSKRIVIFCIYFISIIALSSYSGSVISSLTIKRFRLPFTSIHGFLEDGTYSLGMVKTTWYHTLFQNAKKDKQSHEMQELYERLVRTDSRNTPNTYEDGFWRACDIKYGFITEEEAFYSLIWNCTLQSLPDHFAKTSISYAFPKDSPYYGLFNHNLLKLMNSGVLRKLYKDAIINGLPSESESMLGSASLDSVLPILFVLCAGYLVSILILILEIIIFNYHSVHKRHIVPLQDDYF